MPSSNQVWCSFGQPICALFGWLVFKILCVGDVYLQSSFCVWFFVVRTTGGKHGSVRRTPLELTHSPIESAKKEKREVMVVKSQKPMLLSSIYYLSSSTLLLLLTVSRRRVKMEISLHLTSPVFVTSSSRRQTTHTYTVNAKTCIVKHEILRRYPETCIAKYEIF
jgi:hypothetical protein